MELYNRDLCIRNAEESDCEQLARWWNDGSVMEHAGFPYGLGISAERIAQQIRPDTDSTRRRLMIEKGGVPIGEMNYSNLGGHAAEIDIKICEADYREKGIGRIVLSMLIRELFNRGYGEIRLDTDPMNARARHVYEKLGFTMLGVRENCWTDQLGNPRSAVDYALRPENFVEFR